MSQRGWVQDANGWRYIKDNGTQAAGEWVYADEDWFWIDDNGYMAKGWRQVDGKWYFLRSNGSMAVNYWEKDAVSGKCYYLGADGVMADRYHDAGWILCGSGRSLGGVSRRILHGNPLLRSASTA